MTIAAKTDGGTGAGSTADLTGTLLGWAMAFLLGAVLLAMIPRHARAQDTGQQLKRFVYDDATFTVHLRSYYLDRTNPAPPNNVGWAAGGWLGYETGWLFNALRFGIVGYTSLPVSASSSTDGTLLFQPGPVGYAVLGQAYGKLKLWDQEFTGFRQLINQPEVNAQDNRMTPNTFEAYTLGGGFGDFTYFAGYVAKEKTRNAIEFRNMANVAGAPGNVSEGMLLAGASFSPNDKFKARVSSYHVPNILTSGYADAAKLFSLTDDIDLRVSGQFMVQGSTGSYLLTGQPFSTWSGGVDLDLIWGPVTLSAIYTQTGSAAAYRSPYGSWAGYTMMLLRDFNRANEGAFMVGTKFDFAAIKLPGFALSTNFAFGNGAINAATGAALSTNNEYDFTLDYLFANSALDWPKWLRPLWIRGRMAMLDQFQNGALSTIRDYRVIVNYEWKFSGKER
jgi:hypothetical protein